MRARVQGVLGRVAAAVPSPTTVLDVAGAGLVVAGVALVYVPAALMVAGVALLAASWAATRGGES